MCNIQQYRKYDCLKHWNRRRYWTYWSFPISNRRWPTIWSIYEDYVRWGTEALERLQKWDEAVSIPYFPNASIGWDDTPRFPHKTQKDVVHLNQSPQSFAAFLQKAKEYCDKHPDQPKLITVYAWNEWVEGAYLLPDMKYGFDYLNAVKDVMVDGKYEKYTK